MNAESNALGIENCPQPTFAKGGSDTACVRVDLRGPDGPNDLLSCLSSQLGLEIPQSLDNNVNTIQAQGQVLVAPSDVIAFELVRPNQSLGSTPSQNQMNASLSSTPFVTPFRYPVNVYLDQFLLENAKLAGEKRTARREMGKKLRELTAKRESLTSFEVSRYTVS